MKRGILTIAFVAICVIVGILLLKRTSSSSSTKKGVTIVTTVAPLTNIAKNIAGNQNTVIGLIPDGVDSHTYEPTPGNAQTLSTADIIFVNGLSLEDPTVKLANANKKESTPIIELGKQTITQSQYVYDFSFPKENGVPNPHLWMNPMYALRYAEIIKNELSKKDQPNKAVYDMRYETFKKRIETLDTAIQKAIETIPPNNRKLLTYHDSFAYFAPRYGMTVIGAIQPSSFKEPSSQEVAALIEQLKKEHVPAIFGSEVFPSKVLDAIGQEAHVQYIDTLRDDDLPLDPKNPRHSYINLMVTDVQTITKALGGNPQSLDNVDTTNIE